MRRFGAFITVIAALLFLTGRSSGGSTNKAVYVAAASSLKDVLTEVKVLYQHEHPNSRLTFTFASSGTLQHQIEQGAPADLFISAGKKQVDTLYTRGLVEAPQVITGNELVVVVPAESKKPVTSIAQLTSGEITRIALGSPETVPAGQYARDVLARAGILDTVQSKLVLTKDVRQVLAYVETGNADAGFVYQSDTLDSKKIRTAFAVPREMHSAVVYPAALVKDSANLTEARMFLNFLQTDAARAVFKRYGFTEAR